VQTGGKFFNIEFAQDGFGALAGILAVAFFAAFEAMISSFFIECSQPTSSVTVTS
jgi:hypothetical protein